MENRGSAKPIDKQDSPVGARAPTECLAPLHLEEAHDEYLSNGTG